MHRLAAIAVVLAALAVQAGCGGGGSSSHTYIITPSATSGSGLLAAGIYITIISPVALPQSALKSKDVTFVEHATGPEVCSRSVKITGAKGKNAYLNGKTVTVKVNGSNPFISAICSALKKGRLNPTNIGGAGTTTASTTASASTTISTTTSSLYRSDHTAEQYLQHGLPRWAGINLRKASFISATCMNGYYSKHEQRTGKHYAQDQQSKYGESLFRSFACQLSVGDRSFNLYVVKTPGGWRVTADN